MSKQLVFRTLETKKEKFTQPSRSTAPRNYGGKAKNVNAELLQFYKKSSSIRTRR